MLRNKMAAILVVMLNFIIKEKCFPQRRLNLVDTSFEIGTGSFGENYVL